MSDALLELAARADLAVKQAERLRAETLAQRREAFIQAKSEHTAQEIADVTEMTRQRVCKIIDGNAKPKTKRVWVPEPVDL